MVSYDFEVAFHVHPDDYGNLETMSEAGAFYVEVTLPKAGTWLIASSFIFSSDGGVIMREGFAQTTITVQGSPAFDIYNIPWNYQSANSFKTHYIGANEIFEEPINVTSNSDPDGIYAVFSVGDTPFLNTVTQRNCTPIYLSLYYNSSLTPANLVPFLNAPVHFTMASEFDAIYHAHGTYLPAGMDFAQARAASLGSNSTWYNLTMNMLMMGWQYNNTLNCLSDAGKVMMEMDMDMTIWYGPATYGPTVVGIFDFPNAGNWRVWAYVKVLMPNGTERLIVPDFAVNVPGIRYTTVVEPMADATVLLGNNNFVASVMCLLLLFFYGRVIAA